MVLQEQQLIQLITGYFWPFVRISALIAVAPIFGTKVVPARVRIVIAVAITMAVVPALNARSVVDPISWAGLIVTLNQVIVGASIGFFLRMLFSALETGGYAIGMTMGLGFAQMNDPANGVVVPVVSQMYTLLATLIFLSLNGHLVLMEVLVESFSIIPVAGGGVGEQGMWALLSWAGWIFKGALIIALPAVTALLIVNISFGVMMRAAPQLNVFSIGFPLSLLLGFVFILVSLPIFSPQFQRLLDETFLGIGGMLLN